ncbi:protein adenylyltransferase SelO [Cohnella hashimotonis]|uniref:Protein nucleotidyltransferase YdiU n=1 Tax=Cohnella hashimotonis TaxID=2826895 RepID=A0ABT6TGK7_9BACL|nr:YdiU family protein [Cohnella hashimotonis]MDI4645978.1 YdiU family protein [Cohnella hashimotonis]
MTNPDSTTAAGWRFDNSYARLPAFFYSKIPFNPVGAPKLAVLNVRLAESLGLSEEALRSEAGLAVLAGNAAPEGAEPLAQAYAGHQFGHLTMLGDGRALLLGEHLSPDGRRRDIQLKGSGRTPYSRGGDGRAALGPMLREYAISEAMHGLGIPTTRSLAVVATGEPVFREDELPGAILTRVAASHIRVGTFQYAAGAGGADQVRVLADYTMQRHDPEIEHGDYLSFLKAVVGRQAALIAKWQLVGFVHGVMNTDNMAIGGETIDYGPCAFLDAYDPSTVFSSIDANGRYAYNQQPRIAAWNLARFAETLLPLLHKDEERAVALAEREISAFPQLFEAEWLAGMRAKLGLPGEASEDEALAQDLLELMETHRADYTNTFASLAVGATEQGALFESDAFASWHGRWRARIGDTDDAAAEAQRLMTRSNPAAIARNHRVEEALEAAVERGDYGVLNRLVEALRDPFAYAPAQAEFAEPPHPSCGRYRTFCGT